MNTDLRFKNITISISSPVIPVKTGIRARELSDPQIPACAGMTKITKIFTLLVIISFSFLLSSHIALAQAPGSSNPNSSAFRLGICDGPPELAHLNPETGKIDRDKNDNYVYTNTKFTPCNFKGLMLQVQHLITIMLTAGVFVAIIGFSYAGYLYMTGVPGKITQAHGIFKQVGVGFIIMLSAWFIVYQVLSWLTGNPGLKALLGTP